MKSLAEKHRFQEGDEDGKRRKRDKGQGYAGILHGLKKGRPMHREQNAQKGEGKEASPGYEPKNIAPNESSKEQRSGSENNAAEDDDNRGQRKHSLIAKKTSEAEQQDGDMNAQQIA